MRRIDKETLFVIRRRLRELRLRLLGLVRPLESAPAFIEQLRQQFVGLIFRRLFLDDLIQHRDRFVALIRENKTGSEFFAGV